MPADTLTLTPAELFETPLWCLEALLCTDTNLVCTDEDSELTPAVTTALVLAVA